MRQQHQVRFASTWTTRNEKIWQDVLWWCSIRNLFRSVKNLILPTVTICSNLSILIESCGVADLITTCSGGRNRRVAEAFINSNKVRMTRNHASVISDMANSKECVKSIEQVEQEILNGQKLQGTTTAQEVHRFLEARNKPQE